MRRIHQEGILLDVEHLKAHHSKNEKKNVALSNSLSQDELAKDGAMLDGGEMAQIRASTAQQKREEVHAALQCAASFHCLVDEWRDGEELKPEPKEIWVFVDKKVEAKKHRTVWCATTSRYRCIRCGRSSKKMNMPGGVRDQSGREWNSTPS